MRPKSNLFTVSGLDNGIPLVHILNQRSGVAFFGVAVKAGSRNEIPDEYGLAHFVEHTIFKGTERRKVYHIVNRMEAVGGELNAYTTKEETVVYSVFPNANLRRASELIADLIVNSLFPARELDKERQVVADEIDSYLDSPSDAIYDDFEDLIFRNSQLGHNILGSVETLSNFDSNRCRRFLSDYYRPDNLVAFYSGPQSVDNVKRILNRELSIIPNGKALAFEAIEPTTPLIFDNSRTLPIHQVHCVMGARIGGYLNFEETVAYNLLANVLGGPGMNSLLNVDIRERRGLAYTVEASTSLFSDCGLLTIYFGCDLEDRIECYERVRDIIAKFDAHMTLRRFNAAKRQFLGQMVIASENRESMVLGQARSVLWRGDVTNNDTVADKIAGLNYSTLVDCAKRIDASISSLTFLPQ